MPASPQRIAFLGGTFDPPHLGHLSIARDALRSARLDHVYFLPAVQSPLKPEPPEASFEHRLGMVEAAIEGEPGLGVLDIEREGGEISYTVETARRLAARFPAAGRFWIVGADQFEALPRWHQPEQLAREIAFLVLRRPGYSVTPPPVEGLRYELAEGSLVEISSTEVRKRIKEGLPIDNRVPSGVNRYITQNGIYV